MTTRLPASHPRSVLARALTNDANGTVSAADARQLLDATVKDIAKAADPEKAFESNRRVIDAALALTGAQPSARSTLQSFERKGQSAVSARLQQLTGQGELPADLRRAFKDLMAELGVVEEGARLTIKEVREQPGGGYSFRYEAGEQAGTAHAMRQGDGWLLTPVKLSAAALQQATEVMRAHFDERFAPDLRENGASAAEIRAARKDLVPQYAFFPGSSDPQSLTDSYPVVLSFRNSTGSDHGFYVGLNPRSGEAEAYDFN